MSGGHMTSTGSSGGGGGGGSSGSSGRSQFRSRSGCCICGTKSSSSRFTMSTRYSSHFAGCFGALAADRVGDLCNACVLCVKRWIQRSKQADLFVQVLDSKKGPGPKHMKEITKRARRREAREATVTPRISLSRSDRTASLVPTTAQSQIPNNHSASCLSHVLSGPTSPICSCMGPTLSTRSSGTTGYCAAGLSPIDGPKTDICSRQSTARHIGAVSTSISETSIHLSRNGVNCTSVSRMMTNRTCSETHAPCAFTMARSPAPMNGRFSVGATCVSQSRQFCSPYPAGATVTRAAAAAIRKSGANITLDCSRTPSTGSALSSSTPTRGTRQESAVAAALYTKNLSPSVRSETSEYGSLAPGCCSSSCSSTHGCLATNDASSSTSSGCGCGSSTGFGCGGGGGGSRNSYRWSSASPLTTPGCNTTNNKLSNGSNCSASRSCCSNFHSCYCHHHWCGPAAVGSECGCTKCIGAIAQTSGTPYKRAKYIDSSDNTNDLIPRRTSEFRHPPPPNTSNAIVGCCGFNLRSCTPYSPTSSNGSNNSVVNNNGSNTRRYNRRVILPPVRMKDTAEVNSLLREIMESNSQALNFDPREMHMAVQRELRLRSRTVQGNSTTSDSISGRASSISSADGSIEVSAAASSASVSLSLSTTTTTTNHVTDLRHHHFNHHHHHHYQHQMPQTLHSASNNNNTTDSPHSRPHPHHTRSHCAISGNNTNPNNNNSLGKRDQHGWPTPTCCHSCPHCCFYQQSRACPSQDKCLETN